MVHGERRRGRSRSRVLYWFRTPPGVRVGRAPLDPDAIRLIEAHNPDVTFDWPRILKGDGVPAAARARPDPQDRRARPDRSRGGDRPSGDTPRQARPPAEIPGPAAAEPPAVPVPTTTIMTTPQDPASGPDAPAAAAPEPALEASHDRFDETAEASELSPEVRLETAAGVRLGAEGLGRLRARYAEVIARILEKIEDPAGQGELNAQAERLNPDNWVTDDEVTAGLEQYEAVYESLRAVVGRRRQRRSR